MKALRSFVRSAVWTAALMTVLTGTAFAQAPEAGGPPKGFCAPWHRCAGLGLLVITALTIGLFALGWLVQSRGFDKVEHRQGNPEGVKVDKT